MGNEPTIESLQAELTSYRKDMGELLAFIHGDGGHHQAKHGRKQSATDAVKLFHKQAQEIATLKAGIAAVRDLMNNSFGVNLPYQEPSRRGWHDVPLRYMAPFIEAEKL